jgi:hypothetical protein
MKAKRPLTERGKAHIKAHNLQVLTVIGGTTIYAMPDGKYICFVADLDVCTDGTGDHHGDSTPLDTTAYNPYLNADKDKYIVVPPQVRTMPDPVVLGCQAKVTRLDTQKSSPAVVGEIGPNTKTGEAAICLAQHLNPDVSANDGDERTIYFYELWPGTPAKVGSKIYKLQPA